MHTKFKKSELAKALDVQNSYIGTYIKRGRLILGYDNLIDIQNPLNDFFIKSLVQEGKIFDINRVFEKKQFVKKDVELVKSEIIIKPKQKKEPKEIEETGSFNYLEQKQKLELQKLRLHNEIESLKKEKIEGSLVPVDAMQEIFLWVIDQFHNSYSQEVNSLANIYVQILGADHSKYNMITKELIQTLNKLKSDAKENIISGIDGIVENYQEVRGRGERK